MIFSISWCLLIFSFYFSLEVQSQKSTEITADDIKNGCASKSPNGDCPTDSVPDMIKNAGFKMVNYTVVTKDGYYLTVFRIPFSRKESKAGYHQPKNGKKPAQGKQQKAKAQKAKAQTGKTQNGKAQNGKAQNGKVKNGKAQNGKKKGCKKQPVLMVHGLFGDASHFVMHDVDKAPAYVLADNGYDVWIQNSRGSVYSQKHKTYEPTPFGKFWDFSHVELGNFDIPAVLDAIIKVTGCPKVIYVGHSLGTTQFFSGMALQPAQNKKIKCMIGLAPVAYVDDIKSVIKPFAISAPAIQAVTALSGEFEFGANNTHAEKLKALACSNDVVQTVMCQNLLFMVAGFDSPQVYKPWFPTIVAHVPWSI